MSGITCVRYGNTLFTQKEEPKGHSSQSFQKTSNRNNNASNNIHWNSQLGVMKTNLWEWSDLALYGDDV